MGDLKKYWKNVFKKEYDDSPKGAYYTANDILKFANYVLKPKTNIMFMTKEEKKQRDDVYASLIAHDKDEDEKRMKCLGYVKTKVTDNLYDDIINYVKECDFTDRFEITNTIPSDECKILEDYDYLKEVWVDQYCNGGYVGDDFDGWVNIKINEKEFLKFHYSM